jgi:hypothetical protein
MIDGKDESTSTSSSDGNKTPDTNSANSDHNGTNPEGGSGEPAGKGRDAEARINQLLSKVKDLEEKLGEVSQSKTPAPVPGQRELTPEMQKAAEQIANLGFPNEDAVNKKIQSLEDRILLDTEHGRLESRYDGSDGRPKYVRTEVEKFMRNKAVYNPEIAYENLYKKELLDFEIKQAQKNKPATPSSQSPSGSGAQKGDGVLTREIIREKMTTPEWREFYAKNRDNILTLMQKGQL